jgi:hypothetical protein
MRNIVLSELRSPSNVLSTTADKKDYLKIREKHFDIL